MERVYLDHAATSPVHPEVIDHMVSFMAEVFGNPSSIHYFGRQSRHALDEARQTIARAIGAKPSEVIFTSGGTEADNLALMGVAKANRDKGNHIITSSIEHHAVLNTCKSLEREGFNVTYLPVDESGYISLEDLTNALTNETILVSIMFGNNEVGVIQSIQEISKIVHDHGAIFHTDAVQAFGLINIDVNELGIDLMSVSSHKINGPKGIGFLYVRENVKLYSLIHGGEQERKRRAGTENVTSIAGFARAVALIQENRAEKAQQYMDFKKIMLRVFEEQGIQFQINGTTTDVLPHILNISFKGVNVESLLVNLDLAGIAVSSGSACTAGSIEPSHVLVAMYGRESERIRSSIRFSFGLGNSLDDIENAANKITKVVKKLAKV